MRGLWAHLVANSQQSSQEKEILTSRPKNTLTERAFFHTFLNELKLTWTSDLKFVIFQNIYQDLRLARTKTAIPIRPVQNADCWLQTGCKMQTEILYCFFFWYVICHLTIYRASRNRFFAIIFHDYLYYCAIFLARFLITIVLNIISSLRTGFSLCGRVGWCDVCTEFTT